MFYFSRVIAYLILFLCFFTGSSSLAKESIRSLEEETITIATGPIHGTYYHAGSSICRMVNRSSNKTEMRCEAAPSAGSVYNIESLMNGKYDFAIIQSNLEEEAVKGIGHFYGQRPYKKLRFIMNLHEEPFILMVKEDSKIKSLYDLRKKSVAVVGQKSGSYTILNDILSAIDIEDKPRVFALSVSEQAKALCSGGIDAVAAVTGYNSNMVDLISDRCQVRLIEVFNDKIERFAEQSPSISLTVIKPGDFSGINEVYATISVSSMLVADADTSADSVNAVLDGIFGDFKKFTKLLPALNKLKVSDVVRSGVRLPYHPAARAYFEKRGYIEKPKAKEKNKKDAKTK